MSLPREWSFQAGAAVSKMSMDGEAGAENIDSNQNALGGSLFSIHSAPVFELNVGAESPKRPSSLVMPASGTAASEADGGHRLPPVLVANGAHISSPETLDDDDNLLTISSLTARPLIAKSRELRTFKANKESKWRRTDHDRIPHCSPNPPDGGYGWAIVFGAFFVQFWVAGLVKSYGVLFVEIMETYSDSSAAVASWIPAILSALCLALAPLSSALCEKFSCRVVVFVGGVFCALGLTISYFATSLIHLFFTFGVLTGIGGGLSTTPGIVMVSQYFSKHRALANGICVSGTAAGSFVFPLLIERLCDTFGFHGTILLLGGCMLHVCVSATLYRPLPTKRDYSNKTDMSSSTAVSGQGTLPLPLQPPLADSTRILLNGPDDRSYLRTNKHLELIFINESHSDTDQKIKNNILNDLFNNQNAMLIDAKVSDSDEEKDQIGEAIFMKPIKSMRSSSILHSVEDLSTDSTCVYKSRQRDGLSRSTFLMQSEPAKDNSSAFAREPQIIPKKTWSQKIGRYLDLSLLKNIHFIMMCLSVTLMSTGSPYMLYYLPAYVLSAGYTKSEAGYLVAISAALDLCGRLGLGWLSDLQLFDRRKGYIGSIVGAGVAVLVIPVADSFYVLACSVGMYGLCLGCWFLLVPVLLADQFGTEKISSSYGLVRMFQSVGAISIPPLAGFMRDITGGYEYCFYCMGTCMVLGGVPLLLVPYTIPSDSDSSSASGKISTASIGTSE